MSDPGIVVVAGQGELTIGDVGFNKRGWWTLDNSPLLDFPDMAGGNTRIPQLGGRHANRRYPDETVYRLPMHVTGAFDPDDDPYDTPSLATLAANQDYLLENVVAMSDVTQLGHWVLEDDSIREADVQASIVFGQIMGDYDKPATLYVAVVSEAGRFEVVGS